MTSNEVSRRQAEIGIRMALGAAAVILAVVVVLAGWVPALRAARTDPAGVLRA